MSVPTSHGAGLVEAVHRRLLRALGLPRGLARGENCRIHPTVRVEFGDVTIGDRCRLRREVFIRGPKVRIGNRVFCSDRVYINTGVTIEDDVSIGASCHLVTGHHELGPSSHRADRTEIRPIVIKRGAWLGAAVTVLPGVTIGQGCVIASGAVVTADCEPDSLYAGVPAVLKKRLDPSPAELGEPAS